MLNVADALRPAQPALRHFDQPRLFVDACSDPAAYDRFSLPVTTRGERIGGRGNWTLAAWKLNLRYPDADRYAIFEDDIVCVRDLRAYLELCPYPDRGYWNCYTWPIHEPFLDRPGWNVAM